MRDNTCLTNIWTGNIIITVQMTCFWTKGDTADIFKVLSLQKSVTATKQEKKTCTLLLFTMKRWIWAYNKKESIPCIRWIRHQWQQAHLDSKTLFPATEWPESHCTLITVFFDPFYNRWSRVCKDIWFWILKISWINHQLQKSMEYKKL